MRYTKTAIGLLSAQYRSVLKKCWLINVGLFALGASLIPSKAEAGSSIAYATNPAGWMSDSNYFMDGRQYDYIGQTGGVSGAGSYWGMAFYKSSQYSAVQPLYGGGFTVFQYGDDGALIKNADGSIEVENTAGMAALLPAALKAAGSDTYHFSEGTFSGKPPADINDPYYTQLHDEVVKGRKYFYSTVLGRLKNLTLNELYTSAQAFVRTVDGYESAVIDSIDSLNYYAARGVVGYIKNVTELDGGFKITYEGGKSYNSSTKKYYDGTSFYDVTLSDQSYDSHGALYNRIEEEANAIVKSFHNMSTSAVNRADDAFNLGQFTADTYYSLDATANALGMDRELGVLGTAAHPAVFDTAADEWIVDLPGGTTNLTDAVWYARGIAGSGLSRDDTDNTYNVEVDDTTIKIGADNKLYATADHYTTHLYAGSGSAANAATTNGNTKITVTDNDTVRDSITIQGAGSTTVTSDANGVITIDSVGTAYTGGVATSIGDGNSINVVYDSKALAVDSSNQLYMPYFKANSTGTEASATGTDAVAIGSHSEAKGNNSVALGYGSSADGVSSIAIRSSIVGDSSLGIGTGSSVHGDDTVAIGSNAFGTGDNSVSIGYHSIIGDLGNNIVADNAVAIGSMAAVAANNSTAIGYHTSIWDATGAVALGSYSRATVNDTVSVGYYTSDSDKLYRRIMNADTGQLDHDVAIVGQLGGSGLSVDSTTHNLNINVDNDTIGINDSDAIYSKLPTRNNIWTGTNTFKNDSGITIQSADAAYSTQLTSTSNGLDISRGAKVNGNLNVNDGVLVNSVSGSMGNYGSSINMYYNEKLIPSGYRPYLLAQLEAGSSSGKLALSKVSGNSTALGVALNGETGIQTNGVFQISSSISDEGLVVSGERNTQTKSSIKLYNSDNVNTIDIEGTGAIYAAGTLTADGESKFAKDTSDVYTLDVTTTEAKVANGKTLNVGDNTASSADAKFDINGTNYVTAIDSGTNTPSSDDNRTLATLKTVGATAAAILDGTNSFTNIRIDGNVYEAVDDGSTKYLEATETSGANDTLATTKTVQETIKDLLSHTAGNIWTKDNTFNGNVSIGDADTDTLTVNATSTFNSDVTIKSGEHLNVGTADGASRFDINGTNYVTAIDTGNAIALSAGAGGATTTLATTRTLANTVYNNTSDSKYFKVNSADDAASAGGTNAIAIGSIASAANTGGIAIGYNTSASGTGALAVGYQALTEANGAHAFGSGAKAHSADSMAFGYLAEVYGQSSIAIGKEAKVGTSSSAVADAIALGSSSKATEANTLSVGYYTSDSNKLYRRIVNVEDARDDHDALTKGQVWNTSYADSTINNLVHKTGDETITDAKTFDDNSTVNMNGTVNIGNADDDQLTVQSETTFKKGTTHSIVTDGQDVTMKNGSTVNVALHGDNGNTFSTGTTVIGATETGTAERLVEDRNQIAFYNSANKETILIDASTNGVNGNGAIYVRNSSGQTMDQIDVDGMSVYNSSGAKKVAEITDGAGSDGKITLSHYVNTTSDPISMAVLESTVNGGDLYLKNSAGGQGILLQSNSGTNTFNMYGGTGTSDEPKVLAATTSTNGGSLIMTNGADSDATANQRIVMTSDSDKGKINLKDAAGADQVVLNSTKGTTAAGTNALQVINTQLAGRESGNSAFSVNVNSNNNIITVGSSDHSDIFNVEAIMSLNGDVNIGNQDNDRLGIRSYTTFYQDKGDTEKYYQTILDGQKLEMYAGTQDTAYDGSAAAANRRMALSQSDTGAVFELLNGYGKDGVHLSTDGGVSDFNMYTGNADSASSQAISMHASPTTTEGASNGTSLVMTNGAAKTDANTRFEIYNDATGSKMFMDNSTGANTIQIYSSDSSSAGNGKIIVNEIVSGTVTPVVTLDSSGLTIANANTADNVGKKFTLGTVDLASDTPAENIGKRDQFILNGRMADTFSASDSIFYNGNYGDHETIASTKSVADALGTLSGTNYLIDAEFGNYAKGGGEKVNTVAANLQRIDAKIATWADQYHNIRKSTTIDKSEAIDDDADQADSFDPEQTIGDTFMAIDKAIGTVKNGNYVKTYGYNGTDTEYNIAGNINKLDKQLRTTYDGMVTNRNNLAQLRSEVGYYSNLDWANKNLTYGSAEPAPDIVSAINNLSYTVGKIHGLANSNGSVNSANSTVGNGTNLNYKAKTVSEQLVALDNAIDTAKTRITTNEGNIGNMTFTDTHYIYNDGDLSSAARTLDGKVYENAQNIITINETINDLDVDLTHIKNGMGGSFTGEGGAWTATASTYWNTIDNATSLMQVIGNVSDTIGTAAHLDNAGNGVSADNTVNQNIKAVSSALTNEKNRAIGVEGLLADLTGRAKDKENLVAAINALDSALTEISGDIINIDGDFGDLNDLTHNAFKPKSSDETFTKATNRAVTNIANGMGGEFDTDGKWSGTASTYLGDKNVTTLIGAVQHVSDAIGTAAELADAGNGISASKTVNANLKALSGSLTGEISRAKGVEGNLNELDSRIVIPEGKDTNLVNAINAEASRAIGAETQLAADIAAERTRATGVEGVVANLTGHALGTTNLVDAVNAVDGALTVETNRATAAEGALDTKISEEKTRAEGVEAGLSTAITNEVTRATAAEGNLIFQMANGNFNQTTTKTLTDAVNALDTSIGSRADLTHKAISDTSTLAKAINSLAVNVGTGMGGTFNAETGVWSGSVNTYMSESPYQFTTVMGAVQHISDTIGTKAHLGYATGVTPKNGLSYENTVNQNLAALNSAIGDVHSFSEEAGYTNKAKNATDVVDAITKIDNYVSNMSDSVGDLSALQHPAFGTITSSTTLTQATNTAVTNLATGMGGTFAPVTGAWSGSIQTYRDPSAVGVTSIMDAVDHVVNTIGTAADLGHTATTSPANGVSSSNTVNKNIGIVNSKLGNVANFAGDTYTGAAKGATTSVEAITMIDTALSNEITRATTIEGKLAELEGPAAGKTNLVAAINAINGSVTNLGDIINTQGVDLTHIKNGMGGSFTGEGGAWRATASTYWNTIDNATSLMQVIGNVSDTIGTAAQLNNAGNGVSADNTVNQNIKAVSVALTEENGRAVGRENEIAGNLSAEITRATTVEGDLNTAITTVDGRVTALNTTVTNLSTKVTNMGVGMGGTLSDTGVWSGTVQTYRDNEPKAVSSLMGAVNHVINTIGTASELGTANGVSASNTVNKNIGAVSGALTAEINRASAVEGDLNELTVNIPSGITKNLVNAINAVNGKVINLGDIISGQETDLTHIKIGMGGTFDQDTGVWSGTVQTYRDNEPKAVSSLMGAVNHVIDTIGTASELGTANGVSASNTVNKNIGAVSGALTAEINRASTVEGSLGDLTGKAAGKTSLVAAINALDGAVTNIEGDVTTLTNNYTQLNSTVTDLSNSYNILNNTVNILDGEVGDLTDLKHNAISDKSTITKAVNSLAVNVHQGMGGVFAGDGTWSANIGVTTPVSYGAIGSASSITGALTQINSNIGTAADLGTTPLKNGLSTTNSVNANIGRLNTIIGDLSRFTAEDYGGTVAKDATNLMSAIESIDSAIKDLETTSSGDLTILINKINNEITNRTDGDNILNEYISNVDERVGNLSDLTHNAISDKTTVTKAINSLAVNVNKGMGGTFDENGDWGGTVGKAGALRYGEFTTTSLLGALTDLSSTIGTDIDLGYSATDPSVTPANGVSKTNSVNKNIAALNTAITNLDDNVVHTTGNEGVAGIKTFSDNLVANGGITTTTLTASGLAKLSGGDTGGLQFDSGQVAKSISTTVGNGSDTALATTSAVKNYVGTGVLSVKMNGTVNNTTFGANASDNALIDLGAIVTNVAEGTTNGTISVTQNGATGDVKVHGLGSAAYTESNSYATYEQGAKADSALQGVKVNNTLLTVATDKTVNITIAEGDIDGSIKVNGTDIDVHGLKGGAFKDVDSEVIASSANLITSGAVSTALSGKLDTSVFNARTVNGRALATDIELVGTDIKLTGYSKPASTSAIAATDSVSAAIGKLEAGLDGKYDKTGGELKGNMWFASGNGIKYGDITVTDLATAISNNPTNTKFVTEKAVSDYVGTGDLKLTINGVQKTAFNANADDDLAIDLGSYVTQQQPDSAKGKVLTVNATTGMVEATQIANTMLTDNSITKNKFVTEVQNSLTAADSALQGVKINGTLLTVDTTDHTVNIIPVVNGTDITANSGTAEEPVYTNDSKLTTSKAVREYVTGIDGNVVHKTGNETINGVKTFGDNIVANGGISTTTLTASGLTTLNGGDTGGLRFDGGQVVNSISTTIGNGSNTVLATTSAVKSYVGDKNLTIKVNNTSVGTFNANESTQDREINIDLSDYQTSNIGTTDADKNKVVITNNDGNITTSTVTTEELNLLSTAVDTKAGVTDANAGKLIKVGAIKAYVDDGLDTKYDKTGGLLSGDMWFATGNGIKYGDITVTGLATSISSSPVDTKFVTEKAVSDYVGKGDLKLTINGVEKTAFNANTNADLAIDLGSYVTQQQPDSAKGKVLTVNAETGMVEATQIANSMIVDNSITKNKFVTEVQNSLDAADSALQGVKINGTALTVDTTDHTVNIVPIMNGTDITANSGTAEEPVYTNDGKLTSSKAVREYVTGIDNNVVHKTGAETINGVKTFGDNIVANGGVTTTTVTASSDVTAGGLIIKNGSGDTAYTSQTIDKIDSSTSGTTPLISGSNTTMATTNTVFNTVGNLTSSEMTSGIFAGSTNTVVGKLSKLKEAIADAGGDISDLVAKFYNITSGSDKFDGNEWKANVSTYLETREVNNILGAADVVSDTIGTVTDLGYASEEATGDLANGISRNNTVNKNISSLNTALSSAQDRIGAIEIDYVTKKELHGKAGASDNIVNVGENADNINIGKTTAGIAIDTTNNHKTVDIAGDTITLDSQVVINKADRSSTFGSNGTTVKIKDGAITATGNTTTAGLIIKNGSGQDAYTSQTINRIDNSTAPLNSGSNTTMATTATVFNTVGNISGLSGGIFENTTTVAEKLGALNEFIGDKSALGNDASNGISDKTKVTNAISSLATHVGQGLGGSFNSTSGVWSGSIQTYRDTDAYNASSVMDAISHVSGYAIGSVEDLGYDEDDPTVTPANGVSKDKSVNSNLAALNTAITNLNDNVVHKTGNETINGVKTFEGNIVANGGISTTNLTASGLTTLNGGDTGGLRFGNNGQVVKSIATTIGDGSNMALATTSAVKTYVDDGLNGKYNKTGGELSGNMWFTSGNGIKYGDITVTGLATSISSSPVDTKFVTEKAVSDYVGKGVLSVKMNGTVNSTTFGANASDNALIDLGAIVTNVAEGTTDGTISVTQNGSTADVKVHGLGSAAYTDSTSYATYAQGLKADSALQGVRINNGDPLAVAEDKTVNIEAVVNGADITANSGTAEEPVYTNDGKLTTSKAVREYVSGIDSNVVHKTGAETINGVKTFGDNIVANGGVTTTTVEATTVNATTVDAATVTTSGTITANGLITANDGVLIKDGESLTINDTELKKVLKGDATLTDDDDAIATSKVIKTAISTSETKTKNWVKGDNGAQTANFVATGSADDNILKDGTTRNIKDAINYLGTQTYDLKQKSGDYVTKKELYGIDGESGDEVKVGNYADKTTIGTADGANIIVNNTDGNKKVDVTGDTINLSSDTVNLGSKVTVNGQTGETTFGSGTNTVSINNGAITATGNTTTGGLVIKNGNGTSQTINKIDKSTTALTSGSKTTMATTATVFNTVGDVTELNSGIFAGSPHTVVGKLSALDTAVGIANTEIANAKTEITNAKTDITNIKNSTGGTYKEDGSWSATATTYKSSIPVTTMMQAVNHVSNTIGTVADLGYSAADPTVVPANGISKNNTVNQNIAALNSAIGDLGDLTVDTGTGDKNIVKAINKVNNIVNNEGAKITNITAGGTFDGNEWKADVSTYLDTREVNSILGAVNVVSDTIGTAAELANAGNGVSAKKTVNANIKALSSALTEAKQTIEGYVTKEELYGKDGVSGDEVKVGNYADKTTIGTADGANIIVNNTEGNKTVQINGDTIKLGNKVKISKNGTVTAAGIKLGNNTVTSIDIGEAPITSETASTTTLATTATVLATANTAASEVIKDTFGGELDEDGKWSARASTYYNTIEHATKIMDAVDNVSNTIGTKEDLGEAKNGVSVKKTVNANIAAMNSALGKIDGLVAEDGSVNSTTVASTVGAHSNLKGGKTVEDYLVSLDNSVGDRNYASTNVVKAGSSAADAISALDKSLGSAADLKREIDASAVRNNGVSSDNSVNANVAALNSAIGEVYRLKNTYWVSDATSVTDAVISLDEQLHNMGVAVNDIAYKVDDMRKEMRNGLASAAALSALVPNARSTGKTSLSLGTGGYKGASAVAVGGFHYFTDNLLMNVGASWGKSDMMYRVGVTYTF